MVTAVVPTNNCMHYTTFEILEVPGYCSCMDIIRK